MPSDFRRILLIEDDRALSRVVTVSLEHAGFRVMTARDGEVGLEAALQEKPDLVILDVMLPGRSGVELCRELRRLRFPSPVLMLTGRIAVEDRVTGLEAGADDYLAKPFDERELLARVHALLRRQSRVETQPVTLTLGTIRVDLEHRRATRASDPLALTKTEFALLELLARSAGRPVSRRAILGAVWGYARTPDTRTVDTHVWRLRKKIGDNGAEPRWIRRAGGEGYLLVADAVTTSAAGHAPGDTTALTTLSS